MMLNVYALERRKNERKNEGKGEQERKDDKKGRWKGGNIQCKRGCGPFVVLKILGL